MVICYGVMVPESGRLCKLLVRESAKAEDSLEVEPLVCRVLVMVLQPVRALVYRSLRGVLCVVFSSTGILRNSLMGYAPTMLISLSWNTWK